MLSNNKTLTTLNIADNSNISVKNIIDLFTILSTKNGTLQIFNFQNSITDKLKGQTNTTQDIIFTNTMQTLINTRFTKFGYSPLTI